MESDLECFYDSSHEEVVGELADFMEPERQQTLSELADYFDFSDEEVSPPQQTLRTFSQRKPIVPAPASISTNVDDVLQLLRSARAKPSVQAQSVSALHAEQVQQLTSQFRSGRSMISYPILPEALRLSNL